MMMEDQAFMLNLLAAWGVFAMIVAFYFAMRKIKKTEQNLAELQHRLNDAYAQLSMNDAKIKVGRQRSYRNGFVVGFRNGINSVRGDKFVVDEDYQSDDNDS